MEKDTRFIGFYCPTQIADLVDEHAEIERRSRSGQMVHILETWLMDKMAANKLVDEKIKYETEPA